MYIRRFVVPIAAVGLGASVLVGCSNQQREEDPNAPFRPTRSYMAQCQDGKMVVVKAINMDKKAEGAMTTSHKGATCRDVVEPKPNGSRYTLSVLSNNIDATIFYPGLHASSASGALPAVLPLQSGEYMVVLMQKPGEKGDRVVDPAKPETIGNSELFKQLESAAIGRVHPPKNTDPEASSGPRRFWPTYGLLAQCQDGKMVHIAADGKPPRDETPHKANPSVTGKPCDKFGGLRKGSLAQTGRLDANDDLAVSGIYESDGILYSPSGYTLKSGEYLLALIQEPGKKGRNSITLGTGLAKSFNRHPLVKPLLKAAPPLSPASQV